MARQIGVRAYVSEAAAHKSFAHRDGLGPAVLQDEPAAGLQVLRPPARRSARSLPGPVTPAISATSGSKRPTSGARSVIAARDVGRIRGDDVETPARERGEPAAALEADVAELQPRRIAPRDLERLAGHIDGRDLQRRALARDRERDGAAAGAEIRHAPVASGRSSASARSTTSSVSGRGISTAGVTSSSSDQNSCCPRMYATGSPCRRRLISCWNDQPAGGGQRALRRRAKIRARQTGYVFEQQLGVEPRGRGGAREQQRRGMQSVGDGLESRTIAHQHIYCRSESRFPATHHARLPERHRNDRQARRCCSSTASTPGRASCS